MGSSQSTVSSRTVDTTYGKVVGTRHSCSGDKDVDVFRGIPYAKPPIGELRFKKPIPPDPWQDVKRTVKYGPRSIQKDTVPIIDTYKFGRPSEDCLTLNVFTPCWETPKNGFPVFFYIHGGGYTIGEAARFGCENICETLCCKDVIVVTIQYRLGYLGFLATGDSECPGNFGLWDQVLALQWVQDNIGFFGGDKNNVTVGGQSAGASSTYLLHLSPHSTNLFHKAAIMASTYRSSEEWSNSDWMVGQSKKKVQELGIDWDSKDKMHKLRSVSAERFAAYLSPMGGAGAGLECTPIIDGDFFPCNLTELVKTATPKPILTGVTQLEALLFEFRAKPSEAELRTVISHMIPASHPDKALTQDRFLQRYVDLSTKHQAKDVYRALVEAQSDFGMNMHTLKIARDSLQDHPELPVYSYVFAHYNPAGWGPLRFFVPLEGATHCFEIPYLIGKKYMLPYTFDEMDKKVSRIFSTAFINFAKCGNPNGSDAMHALPVEWEPVELGNLERHYVINSDPHMEHVYYQGRPSYLLKLHYGQKE